MIILVNINYTTNKNYCSDFVKVFKNIDSIDQFDELKQNTIDTFNKFKKSNVIYVEEIISFKIYNDNGEFIKILN